MQAISIIQAISIWIIPVLFAITLHEAAHAWAAYRCGDSTAYALGRLSINPIRHVDFIGTIVVPLLVAVMSGFQFIFGWAKPVPINWLQLKNPKRDMAIVAAAGPLSNLLMAFLWALIVKMGLILGAGSSKLALFLVLSGKAGILINLVLGILNLIPIPPLDGSRILASFLPIQMAGQLMRIEPYGFLILLVLLFTGLLGQIIFPPLIFLMDLINSMVGI